MVKLSVIMPIYNAEKFLKRSIESVLNQTFTDLELILVNDGSTDDSLSICREYEKADERVIVIDKKNEGAGPTRNCGIKIAKGKYLAFPDADDRLSVDAYQYCIETIESSNAELLIFGMSTEVFDDANDCIKEIVEDNVPNLLYTSKQQCREKWVSLAGQVDLGSPCNKIYLKSIIDEHQIEYPDMRRMQDCVFNFLYYDYIQSVQTIDKNFFIRTWHSKEVQRKKMPADFIKCAIQYYETEINLFHKWGIGNEKNLVFIGDAFSEIILTALFEYLPSGKPTFNEIYKHIKSIVSNEYIHNFYKTLAKRKRLRKLETVIKYKMALLLSLYLCSKTRIK